MEFRGWLRCQGVKFKDCRSSVVVPAWGECIVTEDVCENGKPATQLAYETLKKHYPDLRLRWSKEQMRYLDAKAPQIFKGEYWGELGYIDIKSAHAQLYKYLYLRSQRHFTRHQFPMYLIAEELHSFKLARNCVVGICRSVEDKWVEQGEVSYRRKLNPYLSPTLWWQIAGILNQIASVMLGLGAVWINTDGYLFDQERNYRNAIHWFLDREILISHGWSTGYILAINNYYVKGLKSCDSDVVGKEPIHNIEHNDYDFLKGWLKNRERIDSDKP